MLEFVKQWVINIVALVLFIVLFEMLLPTGKMKKYVSLATGTILIIAIITPLVGVLGKNTDITAFQISNSNYLDRLQVEKDSKFLEKEQMEQIVSVYRDKIIGQLEQSAEEVEGVESARADVIFNEDYNSESFGDIKRAFIEFIPVTPKEESSTGKTNSSNADSIDISSTNKESADAASTDTESSNPSSADTADNGKEAIEPVSRIGKINTISKVQINNKKSTNQFTEKCDPIIKKKLEDKISTVFGINSDNIVISQVKR